MTMMFDKRKHGEGDDTPAPPAKDVTTPDCVTCVHREDDRCSVYKSEEGLRPLCTSLNSFNQCGLWEPADEASK